MNPQTAAEARSIFAGIKRAAEKKAHTSVVVCPPSVFLPLFSKTKSSKVAIGAQNISHKAAGAYTGEVSAAMAKESGATYTIIGHSERRAMGETNEIINKKIAAAFQEKLNVILCIGEQIRDPEGQYLEFIKQEIVEGLSKIDKKSIFSCLIVAYEPIWAIGKDERDAMKGAQMHEMTIYIRKIIGEMFDRTIAEEVPILYGGSVSSFNAADIVKQGHVDGLLVGRQSLNPKDFGEILTIVDGIKAPKS